MRQQNSLADKKILVTAGGTREAIDAVRFIGNRSSGKQGYAVAEEALHRGAEVALVATVLRDLPEGIDPSGIDLCLVESAAEMRDAVLPRAAEADVVVMAAAVADFRPSSVKPDKYKKSEGVPVITLEPTADILAELGKNKPASQVLVGFAAESDDLEANACRKLAEKGADIIVANNIVAPDAGFDSDTNEVMIFAWSPVDTGPFQNVAGFEAASAAAFSETAESSIHRSSIHRLHVPSASKRKVASVLLDVVEGSLAAIR